MKTYRMTQRLMMMSCLSAGLILLTANVAVAQHKAFFLYVKNGDSIPVTISFVDGPCYQGGTPRDKVWENVLPGNEIRVHVQRNNISQCEGEQGRFSLKFSPKVNGHDIQQFDFDNNGALNAPDHFNRYPGKLSPTRRGPSDESDRDYTYITARSERPEIVSEPGPYVSRLKGISDIAVLIPGQRRSFKTTSTESEEIFLGREIEKEKLDETRINASIETEIKDPITESSVKGKISAENRQLFRKTAKEHMEKSVDRKLEETDEQPFEAKEGQVCILVFESWARYSIPGKIRLGSKELSFTKRSGGFRKNIPHCFAVKSSEFATFVNKWKKDYPSLFQGSIMETLKQYMPD